MRTTGANIAALNTAVSTAYNQGRVTYTPLWPQIATLVQSTTAANTYAWLGEFTRLREWLGERQINRMAKHTYTLANIPFEGTEAVKRSEVEDDTYGVLMPKFQDMGYAAACHPDELIFELLAKGFDEQCYDGQNFFDADHKVGPLGQEVSVSNMQTGTKPPWFLLDTSRPLKPLIYQQRKDYNLVSKTDEQTSDHVFNQDEFIYGVDGRGTSGFGFWQQAFGSKAELTTANFDSGVEAMMSFKSDKDRPLGINPTILIVGPKNRAAAKSLIETQILAGGGSNPNYKAVTVLVVPWLA